MVDSLEIYRNALYKAQVAVFKLKALNDTAFAISTSKMQEMNNAYTTVAGRHFLGIIIGFIFLGTMVALLIWKGRKIQKHYEAVVDFANLAAAKNAELEAKLAEYDGDYKPLEQAFKGTKSKWPRFYVHIIYGPVLAFFILYFIVSF